MLTFVKNITSIILTIKATLKVQIKENLFISLKT